MLLVVTHDVDWGRWGPSDVHVIERLHRFDLWDRARFFGLRENLYNGISLVMEFEQRQGFRSTFFFRPFYDDGTSVELYADVVSELRRGGWEVGLHANKCDSLESIAVEKRVVEKVYAEPVASLRAHYLRIDKGLIQRLGSIGIKFDSSLTMSRNMFRVESSGCGFIGSVVELPITIMDTYMFSYWGVNPLNAFEKLIEFLSTLHKSGVEIATILWHTNSVRMVGGRSYLKFVEEIWRFEWLEPIRVKDVEKYLSLCRKVFDNI